MQHTGTAFVIAYDNEVGKSDIVNGAGFGGQLVLLLTQQLSDNLKEENNDGTHIILEFTVDSAA